MSVQEMTSPLNYTHTPTTLGPCAVILTLCSVVHVHVVHSTHNREEKEDINECARNDIVIKLYTLGPCAVILTLCSVVHVVHSTHNRREGRYK